MKKQEIKKKIIATIIISVAVILLMYFAVSVLDVVLDRLLNNDEKYDFDFYEADYDENIFEDEEYLELIKNGYISYNNGENVTVSVSDENASDHGAAVEFLVKYVKCMINGDIDGYNACYSDLYYTEEEPKDSFTMQKIYDVNITKILEEQVSDNGSSYTQSIFSLSYKILNNNGTLRDDFLTGSKTQYLYINDSSGEYKIDGVTTFRIK